MRYSIEPRDKRYVKDYGFLPFARNIGKNIGKNISNKYSQKPADSAKRSATDAIKSVSKRAIQEIAEATGDLISSKLLIRLQVFQKYLERSYIQKNYHQIKLIMKCQKKDIYLHKRDNKLLMR